MNSISAITVITIFYLCLFVVTAIWLWQTFKKAQTAMKAIEELLNQMLDEETQKNGGGRRWVGLDTAKPMIPGTMFRKKKKGFVIMPDEEQEARESIIKANQEAGRITKLSDISE